MTHNPNRQVRLPVGTQQQARCVPNQPFLSSPWSLGRAAPLLLTLFCVNAFAQGNSPTQLRQFIDQQVGGIDKLKVPPTDADIPLPRRNDGTARFFAALRMTTAGGRCPPYPGLSGMTNDKKPAVHRSGLSLQTIKPNQKGCVYLGTVNNTGIPNKTKY